MNDKLKETLNIFYNQKNYYEENFSNLLIENKNLNDNLNCKIRNKRFLHISKLKKSENET